MHQKLKQQKKGENSDVLIIMRDENAKVWKTYLASSAHGSFGLEYKIKLGNGL